MNPIQNNIHRLLLIILLIAFVHPILAQEVKSNRIPFVLNNLPDDEPPLITFLSPELDADLKYLTDISEAAITGRVTDESSLAFIAAGALRMEINDNGLFSIRIRLYPGENRIRFVAADHYSNLQEKTVIIDFQPPGTDSRNTTPSQ